MARSAPKIALALMSLVLLAGCSGGDSSGPASSGPGHWQKTGASEQTVTEDSTACRQIAQAEAVRSYPYSGGTVLMQQRDNVNRSAVEQGQFNNCMQDRGYRRAS